MDFKELYKTEFHLTDLFAMHQRWQNGASFDSLSKPKKTDALLYLKSCSAHYTLENGGTMTAAPGSTVFIPRGSRYKTVFEAVNADVGESLLIEFTLLSPDLSPINTGSHPFTVRNETPPRLAELFSGAVELYGASAVKYAELRSSIYSLIASLSQRRFNKDILSRELAPILPAILYLEQTPSPTASISELADMCHVSQAYFRRLFRKYSSVSPVQYRNNSRIEHAKKLLENTVLSIAEVAAAVGYDDPAYFCRTFKKITGMTPGEYIASANGDPEN